MTFRINGNQGNPCKISLQDVIMIAMASQITGLTVVDSTVYSRRRSKKTSRLRAIGLCTGNSPVTGEFPAQRASNAENIYTLWRHHVTCLNRRRFLVLNDPQIRTAVVNSKNMCDNRLLQITMKCRTLGVSHIFDSPWIIFFKLLIFEIVIIVSIHFQVFYITLCNT